jgi:hypothetical protein
VLAAADFLRLAQTRLQKGFEDYAAFLEVKARSTYVNAERRAPLDGSTSVVNT